MKKKILLFITICLCGFLGFIISEVKNEIERIEQQRAVSSYLSDATDWNNNSISSEILEIEIERAAKEYTELYGDTPRNMTEEEFKYAQFYAAKIQKEIKENK